ncbi:hypothetical protein EfmGK923_18420 [Enterococcus faecium]|nr:hypothetical protein EfmGK923_18420 [Enterococcus faecium]
MIHQFATIDIIFYFYMAKNEKLSEKVKKTREAIQEYLRIKRIRPSHIREEHKLLTKRSFPQINDPSKCFTT